MRLNGEGKAELRQKIEEELEKVPKGQRIHLDKELLEQLLFDICTEELSVAYCTNGGEKAKVKYIVWSGPFLSKIDLSELSFDDVVWDINYYDQSYFEKSPQNHYKDIGYIDLSNTNARIDFSKSFDRKYGKNTLDDYLTICGCDFSGVDLSNNTIDCMCFIKNCNFSNTSINLNLNGNGIFICNSDMSGNDFSAYTVTEKFFNDDEDTFALGCNFSNTGLNVTLKPIPGEILNIYKKIDPEGSSINEYLTMRKKVENPVDVISLEQYVSEQIKTGNLNGCYINGKRILSEEEKSAKAQEKLEEYEAYIKELSDYISSAFDEQINKNIKKSRKSKSNK